MQYVTIENTNLRVSRLTFGTASLHHLYRRTQRLSLLNTALASGITHFDTSPYYGYGLAESDLSLFLQGRRDAITVATKVGLYPPKIIQGSLSLWCRKITGKIYKRLVKPRVNWSISEAERSLNASLKRLKTDYIDILFLHEPEPNLVSSDKFLSWLEKERSKGKIRYWGLAGQSNLVFDWVKANHPLAAVVQTNDSLHGCEANGILNHGRQLQFTYGYFSSSLRDASVLPTDMLLLKALQRNQNGSILFSTRRMDRIKMLAGTIS